MSLPTEQRDVENPAPTHPEGPEGHLSQSAGKRWLLIGLGTICVIIGLIGIVVPGLPTTIFLIMAAACYARGSTRLHDWLLTHRLLGPPVKDWYKHRSLTRKIKFVIILSIGVSSGLCAAFIVANVLIQFIVVAVALVGIWYVGIFVPTRKNPKS
jgi:uncharacterized membrane protein YbaN (DUF454 family)